MTSRIQLEIAGNHMENLMRPRPATVNRVIIDCDPGIDDALALFLACASPEIELLAVTTVAGNRPVETTSQNAGRILHATGHDEAPVFTGCARPLAYTEPRCNVIHGEDGLGGWMLPLGRQPTARHAVDFISSALLESEIAGLSAVLREMVPKIGRLVLVEVEYERAMREAEMAWVKSLMEDLSCGKLAWDPKALRQQVGGPPLEEDVPSSRDPKRCQEPFSAP